MAVAELIKFNRIHESQFASDKLIKTVGFAAGLVAALRRRDARYGPDHVVTVGLQQIAAQCGNARYVLRFHGGYSGVLNEIENFVNVSFLGGWKDPWIKTYTRLQSAALIQYYLYENAGYLGSAAPQWIGPKLAGWGGSSELLRKSCWGWGLSCLLDIAATRRKQDELGRMERKVRAWPHSAAKTQALSLIRRTEVALYINLARMVLFFIPNAQWSLRPDSMFAIQPEWFVQGLSLLECIIGYYSLWYGYSCSRPDLPLPNRGETLKPQSSKDV